MCREVILLGFGSGVPFVLLLVCIYVCVLYLMHESYLIVCFDVFPAVGFGFLTFDNEDSVEQACAEHFVNVSGKQVKFL